MASGVHPAMAEAPSPVWSTTQHGHERYAGTFHRDVWRAPDTSPVPHDSAPAPASMGQLLPSATSVGWEIATAIRGVSGSGSQESRYESAMHMVSAYDWPAPHEGGLAKFGSVEFRPLPKAPRLLADQRPCGRRRPRVMAPQPPRPNGRSRLPSRPAQAGGVHRPAIGGTAGRARTPATVPPRRGRAGHAHTAGGSTAHW